MPGPLVSLIINNYNYGRFMGDAIESALAQGYPDKEVIVVDDGSTDNSRDVIASYGSRIKAVLKENGGQASAFNAGFRESKGELVCFLDSDDCWYKNKVEESVKAALAHPDAVLVYHQLITASEDLTLTGKPAPRIIFQGNILGVVTKSCGWWGYPATSALCFRRRFLDRVMDIPEEEYRLAADAYLANLAPFMGEVYGFRKPLALYRIHGKNYGYQNSPDRLAGEKDAIQKHIRYYEESTASLNNSLESMCLPYRVSMEDHWPYLYHLWKLGDGPGLPVLFWRLLRFPGIPTYTEKLRNTARILLESAGLRRR